MNALISRVSTIVLATILVLTGCSESTEPWLSGLSGSHVSVTGDITESWDAFAIHGTSTYESSGTELGYFTVIVQPRSEGTNTMASADVFKFGAELPDVGTYGIGEYVVGDTIPADEFGGEFSGRNTSHFDAYIMTSGSVTITEVVNDTVRGEFEMSGYYRGFAEMDTSRIVHVVATFIATPIPGM